MPERQREDLAAGLLGVRKIATLSGDPESWVQVQRDGVMDSSSDALGGENFAEAGAAPDADDVKMVDRAGAAPDESDTGA